MLENTNLGVKLAFKILIEMVCQVSDPEQVPSSPSTFIFEK